MHGDKPYQDPAEVVRALRALPGHVGTVWEPGDVTMYYLGLQAVVSGPIMGDQILTVIVGRSAHAVILPIAHRRTTMTPEELTEQGHPLWMHRAISALLPHLLAAPASSNHITV